MTEYTTARDISADPDKAFAYLGEVGNLPKYFPKIVAARSVGEDKVTTTAVLDGEDVGSEADHETVQGDAWFRTDDGARSVEWGAPGPNDYHGSLVVTAAGDGSNVSISLHTEAEHPGIQESLDETLDHIEAALG